MSVILHLSSSLLNNNKVIRGLLSWQFFPSVLWRYFFSVSKHPLLLTRSRLSGEPFLQTLCLSLGCFSGFSWFFKFRDVTTMGQVLFGVLGVWFWFSHTAWLSGSINRHGHGDAVYPPRLGFERLEVSALASDNTVSWDSANVLWEAPGDARRRRKTEAVWSLPLLGSPHDSKLVAVGVSHGGCPSPGGPTRSRGHPSWAQSPHRLAVGNKGGCFKPLPFGILCYTAVENWNSKLMSELVTCLLKEPLCKVIC